MASVVEAAERLAEKVRGQCREAIVGAGALVEKEGGVLEDALGEADLALRDAWLLARRGLRVITLFREPESAMYDPVQGLREKAFMNVPVAAEEGTARRYCNGDEAQVVEGVRLMMESFTLGEGARLRAEVTAAKGTPRVVLSLTGAGRTPRALELDPDFTIQLDDFAQRWIGATTGGHLALSDDAVLLYLEGERPAPVDHLYRPDLAHGFTRAEYALRSWRAASGHYEPGYVDPVEVRGLYLRAVEEALQALDQPW
ncbi:MAG: hypothetical protein GC168_15415 [Candidatus Hydrogenedens sp.]|nr:hypothetical protein [Candidatus Hydrogenedens sp.]